MRRHLLWFLLLCACANVGPHEPNTPMHHHESGFTNQSGVTGTDPIEFMLDRGRLVLGQTGDDAARALSVEQSRAAWDALGNRDAVQWLGHASIRLRLSGRTYLIDPVIGERVSPVDSIGPKRQSPAPVPVEALRDTDAIVVTHDHYDHFEKPMVDKVHAVSGARCFLPLGLEDDDDLNCPVHALDWLKSAEDGPVTLTLLPAQHESGRFLFDRDKTLWGSWLISSAKQRVYFSGDTGYGPHFAELRWGGAIDLAVLNVGGYRPRVYNKHVHMNPEESIRAADDMGAKRVLIVHWGTYPLGLEDAQETFDRLRTAAERANWKDGRLMFVPIGTAFGL